MTPLMDSVVCNNYLAFIYLYFKHSCDPSNLDINGQSLIHLAAKANSIQIAKLLKHLYGEATSGDACSNMT